MAIPNDITRITDGLAKLEASNPNFSASKTKAARTLARASLSLHKTDADAMASTTTAVTAAPQVCMPRAGRLLGVKVLPAGAVTANDTNYGTISISKHDGAGGAATVMASLATQVADGNWVAGTKKTLALSATVANTRFAAGDVIGFAITKTAAGVALPVCVLSLDVEWEGTDSYEVL